jgi:hypothetical protein
MGIEGVSPSTSFSGCVSLKEKGMLESMSSSEVTNFQSF